MKEVKMMVLFKLMFLPLRMLMWPLMAPLRMLMWPFKLAYRFVTVTLLFAQLMVLLCLAAMFVMFTVIPTIIWGLCWIMKKKKHTGWMGNHGKMHMHMPTPRRFKP
ncbi:MAG: hypothetical protein LUQ34_01845 [Euryarchaeota archaeon]|nr:hypothetical protein [Euryarchaeota archaeon]